MARVAVLPDAGFAHGYSSLRSGLRGSARLEIVNYRD